MSFLSTAGQDITSSPLLTVVLAVVALALPLSMGLFRKPLDVKGKRIYITGASSGLGRTLAAEMVKRGALVTCVARDKGKMAEAEGYCRRFASADQQIKFISADLTRAETSQSALDEAMKAWGGHAPDQVYLCAGASKPQFFVDATSAALQWGFDGTYWVSAWTAHAALKAMVSQRVKGKVVFVSSFLGYTSFAGYATYSPGKYALRGLADALRSEMLLHDIAIHIFMPCGIDSPGYRAEQELKPAITKKIEEGDEVLSPERVCGSLIGGLEQGHYQITNLLITDLVRTQAAGAAPKNNVVMDFFSAAVASIGLPIWRMITDYQVRAARKEVHVDLERRGFYRVAGK